MSRTTDTPKDTDIPNPEYLIKSIAEQGYSLETALADLIDNSITAGAGRIEILVDSATEPFVLFLADDGDGMNEETLARNMKFPSSSPEDNRRTADLGRFGLGMKTASFSQTRTFTVLSRKKGTETFHGRTWDVGYLQREKEWKILKNTPEEVGRLLVQYTQLSNGFLNSHKNYAPNTIVVWQGLYKFESYLDNNRQ
ncbi:MAG TPA: ATP-binding protein, partial [Puia sp.]|nr:ATP-binding protein [Puia sp.]